MRGRHWYDNSNEPFIVNDTMLTTVLQTVKTIREDLNLSVEEIATANVVSLAVT